MKQWQLIYDGKSLGSLTLDYVDQPFFHCCFEPTPAFADLAPIFATELISMNESDMDKWERGYQRVLDLRLTLVTENGAEQIDDILIHIADRRAWFRY